MCVSSRDSHYKSHKTIIHLQSINFFKNKNMDEQKNDNLEVVRNLEILNNQVSELLKFQKQAISGYDYINANELAELMGESIKTIYGRVHKKEIPYYKPGGKLLLFKLDEIKGWIKESKHSSIEELRRKL